MEEKAFVRLSNEVYFSSEIKELISRLKEINCLFGGTVFFQRFKSDKNKVKAYLQITKYLDDKKFSINQFDFDSLFNQLKFEKCNVQEPKKRLSLTPGIKIEVFLQEMALNSDKDSSNRALKTMQKILDVKYPVFFYE